MTLLSGITWEPRLCSRVRFSRSGCKRCFTGCPEGALSWGKALDLDREKCTGCGLCLALCANGALWDRGKGDQGLVGEIGFLLSQGPREVFRFACLRGGGVGAPDLALPCLGRLTEALLLAPFVAGAERVDLWSPDCRGCEYERGLSPLQDIIRLVDGLVRLLGLEGQVSIEPGGTRKAGPSPNEPPASRRGFLREAGSLGLQAVVSLLPSLSREERRDPWEHPVSHRRSALLGLMKNRRVSLSVWVEAEGLPLAEIKIDNNCTGCPVCSTLCPPGAITRVEEKGRVLVYFRPWLCSGCGVCWEACLFQAISAASTVSLDSLMERRPRLLAELGLRACPACGEAFLGNGGGWCPSCQVKGENLRLSRSQGMGV